MSFYAEIVKFGLSLTHLKLFGGRKLGKENILREAPHVPSDAATECRSWCSLTSPTFRISQMFRLISYLIRYAILYSYQT